MAEQPPIQILIDGRDLTGLVEDGATWSNVDPGGYEAASFSSPQDIGVRRGAPVKVLCGLETSFLGRIQRVGRNLSGAPGTTLSCEGAGAVFKEHLVREIWIDRDLNAWGDAPNPRKKFVLSLTAPEYHWNGRNYVEPGADGMPSVTLEFNELDGVVNVRTNFAEAWYDAHGIPIEKIFFSYDDTQTGGSSLAAGSNWTSYMVLSTKDDASVVTGFSSNMVGSNTSGSVTATTATAVYALVQLAWPATFSGASTWRAMWSNIAVIGRHGLPVRTNGITGGFYPPDIAGDVLRRVPGVRKGVFGESSYVVAHAVAKDPTDAEKLFADQALLAGGWHWGTWAPESTLDDTPVLDFRPLPDSATCHASRADLDDLQLEEDLSRIYNRALVTYSRSGSSQRTVEVARPVPELDELNIERELPVALGEGDEDAAETQGLFYLALSERAGRASGSATTVVPVRLPGGGTKPACLLRSGIDKLAVTDLPNLPLFAPGRYEFQLKRVESTLAKSGVSTRMELGLGADLLEVLQARMQLEVSVATFGR